MKSSSYRVCKSCTAFLSLLLRNGAVFSIFVLAGCVSLLNRADLESQGVGRVYFKAKLFMETPGSHLVLTAVNGLSLKEFMETSGSNLVMTAVDGSHLNEKDPMASGIRYFDLRPGHHRLTFDYKKMLVQNREVYAGEQTVELEVVRGHTYVLTAKIQNLKIRWGLNEAWDANPYWRHLRLVDKSTGKVILDKNVD